MLRILHDTRIDFIRLWKPVTIALTIFLLPAIVWIAVSGFRFGIEFTGGTLVQLQFEKAPNVGDVRQALTDAGLENTEVQTFGSPRDIVVRAQERAHAEQVGRGAGSVSNQIQAALAARFGAGAFRILGSEAIGARVSSELVRKALIALLISFGVSLIYLAIRFEWRFGLAAVLANVHDILAVFAFIKYLDLEINLFLVGAILTVIGYSLSDTVVVFDRVRELLRTRSKINMRELLNRAVNETLPRTVMTGTTVLACLLALALLGGPVLRPFALVLLFGITIGTISSIYVASPLLLLINHKWPRAHTEGSSTATPPQATRPRTPAAASQRGPAVTPATKR
ncbi:MAG TPA: protein translocase subunit SecF [Gemmatimonadaceae bacterium]|nr:protein translocase subunit SecF [Gemmatimonadaceae bacterium]